MIQEFCPVKGVQEVADGVFVLKFVSERIAKAVRPGQFLNLKIGDETLLRRPFSVYFTNGNDVQVIFHVIGKGTAHLRSKRVGETIDVLGPLGVPFRTNDIDYQTAVLIAGGLGIAPLPLLTQKLQKMGKKIVTLLGSRNASMVSDQHLLNVSLATDDGSGGFHGNVIDLARKTLGSGGYEMLKIFACGPTPMIRALQKFVMEKNIACEASLEGPMGCGFGVCQGCPVELRDGEKKYALMCVDGPGFDLSSIRL